MQFCCLGGVSEMNESGRSEEIKRVIAHLFARQGYDSTSMRGIAKELGMNQSSIYHYFRSKEEMLFILIDEALDDALNRMEKIYVAELSLEEKFKEILQFYIYYYVGDQDRQILLIKEIDKLNEDHLNKLIKKRRRYLELMRYILKELKEYDLIKDIDPTVAAFAFFGMVHYTFRWYREEGKVGLDEMVDIFLEIFTKGVMKG